jgi:Protein of unknown function (DUF2795)
MLYSGRNYPAGAPLQRCLTRVRASAEQASYRCNMAKGIGENPSSSPAFILKELDFPATRAEIVETAEDSESPVEVINFLKSLPKDRYQSQEEALRDFAEAERRFLGGTANEAGRRENLGRR